jgi:hypothetical protein
MAEDDATMREYEMSMEEEIKLLVKNGRSFARRRQSRDRNAFDAVDKFVAIDKKFERGPEVRRDGPEVDTLDKKSRRSSADYGSARRNTRGGQAWPRGSGRAARINGREVRGGGQDSADQMGCSSRSWSTSAARRRLGPAWHATPEIMIPCGA